MTKKLLFKKSFASKIFYCLMIVGSVLLSSFLNAQTCSGTANIPLDVPTTINGIQVNSSFTGSVATTLINGPGICNDNTAILSPGSLRVGRNGPWSVTFTFDKPVNDLVILLVGTGDGISGEENFIFNADGDPASISFTTACYSRIEGNVIFSGGGTVQDLPGGGGIFKISAPNAYTTLTVSGDGGHFGSFMGICSASIVPSTVLGVKDIHDEVEDNKTVTISPNPIKDMMTISSKETLQSYKIFDGSGKLIVSSPIKGKKQEVNLSSVPIGKYVVSVETDRQTVSKKLIKE